MRLPLDWKMFRYKHPRAILNEIKWRGLDISRCEIWYIHRGAPNDVEIVNGDRVDEIGRSYFTLNQGIVIPYHRVLKIKYDRRVVYEKVSIST